MLVRLFLSYFIGITEAISFNWGRKGGGQSLSENWGFNLQVFNKNRFLNFLTFSNLLERFLEEGTFLYEVIIYKKKYFKLCNDNKYFYILFSGTRTWELREIKNI